MATSADQRALAASLRGQGHTWTQIAEQLRARWPTLNALAAIRLAHGWTQAQAAQAWNELYDDHETHNHKTHKDIGIWESRRVSRDTLEKFAKLYQCSIADLLAGEGDYRQLDKAHVAKEESERGGTPARPRASAEQHIAHLNTRFIEQPGDDHTQAAADSVLRNSDVVVIRNMLGALTASDRQFGGGHARRQATDYLRELVMPRLNADSDEQVARDMFTVATEFALRVASMQLDDGHARVSRHLLGLAGRLAQETDDRTLNAWVLARWGEQFLYEKRVAEALAYTAASIALAQDATPTVRSFLLGKQALAYAVAGEKVKAQRALGEAHDTFNQDDGTDAPAWIGNYGRGHVRHDAALCYIHLGMGAKAVTAAEQCMRIRSRGRFARPRAFSLGVEAIGYAQAGEIEMACTVGYELVSVAAQLASDRVRARLVDLLQELEGYQDVAAVRELHESARAVLANAS